MECPLSTIQLVVSFMGIPWFTHSVLSTGKLIILLVSPRPTEMDPFKGARGGKALEGVSLFKGFPSKKKHKQMWGGV